MLETYSKIIEDHEKRGFIERLDVDLEKPVEGYFLTHHPVHKNSLTSPIRIVFNASFNTSKEFVSLNECLEKGPSLITDIVNLLLNFRFNDIGIVSDIEKMFHMIGLHESHRKYARFIWLENSSDPNSKLIVYQFLVILFGTKSSSFVSIATVLKHLNLNPCDISDIIKRKMYVDNIINTVKTKIDAIKFYKISREIFKTGNFNLRCFASNCQDLNVLAASENAVEGNLDSVSILGLKWNCFSDIISLNKIKFEDSEILTKRIVLSIISKLYDPLGFMNPIIMRGKIYMQTSENPELLKKKPFLTLDQYLIITQIQNQINLIIYHIDNILNYLLIFNCFFTFNLIHDYSDSSILNPFRNIMF